MSSEQSLDPQLIERTKQQIRMLVNEIGQLAKSDLSPEQFYGEFLPRVVSALAAVGGAVWVAGAGGRLALGYQINLHQTRLREDEEGQVRHGRLLYQVLNDGEGNLIPPRSGSGDDDQAGNPTDFLLVLAPLKAADETVGVVEIFQRPDTRPATQKGYLRFLTEMCDRAGEFFKTHQLRHFTDRQTLWTQLEEFARGVHASLHPQETAYTIANDGRRLIECDRVSVAIRRGNKCRIEAVSGQDLFDKRSNTVRLLGRLATAVVASGEPVWYTGDTSNMAPQVEDAVQEYIDESHSKTVAVLPLKRPEPIEQADEDPDKRADPQPAIGALIVEQIEDSRVPEKMLHRVGVVGMHSSTALANALEHQNLFLMPLWRLLGKARLVLKARTLPKTVAIVGAIVVVLLFLGFFPYSFTMKADGTLEPMDRQNIYAGISGNVEYIPPEIRHRAFVKKGQPLVTLSNPDLGVEIEGVLGQLKATIKQEASVRRMLYDTGKPLSDSDRIRLEGQREEYLAEMAKLKAQLELLKEKEQELQIRSPANGQIGTWEVRRLLPGGRPVQWGQELMWIFDPSGDWQLRILMPDRRMGHIVKRQLEIEKRDLDVEFILASQSATRYHGKVKEIELNAEVRGDEGNTVLIKVEISDDVKRELAPMLRPGVGVTAKIDCGRRAIGYVWFHDLIAFVQSKILFRWF